MLGRLTLTALLLPGCFDDWKTEHRDDIHISPAEIEPALRVSVDENELVLSLDIEQEDGECFYVQSLDVTLDGMGGRVFNGGWVEDGVSGDKCNVPRAKFELPSAGPASFVVFSSNPDDGVRWTMDIVQPSQPFTWSGSTRVYHPGDTVSIDVPSLGASQVPTIHIHNTELVIQIDANDIERVGAEARFEIPELPAVSATTTATMSVMATITSTVTSCDAPKGCTVAPFQQTLSSSISLAP